MLNNKRPSYKRPNVFVLKDLSAILIFLLNNIRSFVGLGLMSFRSFKLGIL